VRVILKNLDGTVHHDAPFVLEFDCPAESFDRMIVHTTTFAFVVGTIVALLAIVGAMPRPIGGFALLWWGGALVARYVARQRRLQHGRVRVDFDTGRVEHLPSGEPSDAAVVIPLEELTLGLDPTPPADDDDAVAWLVLTPREPHRSRRARRLRLCRGRISDLRATLRIFAQYGIRPAA
jgi:hypothetical protein